MASRAAPPGARRSSPGSRPSAPASPRSACRARNEGLKKEDPTLAELLKPYGYVCGQFGKNHLGDRNEFLPTVHGFDEFFGNLYHLNAEEEPENPDYPKESRHSRRLFGPRGVLHCFASDKDDPTVDPRFGRVGKQTIEDTGPLTKKRMETVDEEFTAAALKFMDKAHQDGKPFFVWWNSTRMHIWTHLKPEVGRQDRPRRLCRRHGRARRRCRPVARQAQGTGHRGQHHRHVFHATTARKP